MKDYLQFFLNNGISQPGRSVILSLFFFTMLSVRAQTPVAYYPFSGNADDATGTNHGTVNGATLTTDRFGNANSAFSFDGVNDVISTASVATAQTNHWTMSAWVKPASLSNGDRIVVQNGGDGGGVPCNGYALGIDQNKIYGYHPCVAYIEGNSAFPTANQWYHIAMVNDGSISKFYINGVLASGMSNTTPLAPNGVVTIGSASGIRFFEGAIDEVKIYNTALTDSQVQLEYNNTNTNGFELLLPIAVSPGGTNGSCTGSNPNNMNGGNASGAGCGGGGAGYYGGQGGAGYLGGGGGGAAGFNTNNRVGGQGGHGAIALALANSNGIILSKKLLVGGSSFTIPAGVTQVKVFAIGAGGGGAGATGSNGTSGGGGAAGGVAFKKYVVAPGDVISYTLGVGGSGGIDVNNGSPGTNTSATLNGLTIIGNGGNGGTFNNNADAPGGTFFGGDGGATGGNGKGTAEDTGGGAGGGIGGGYNSSVTCTGGLGANALDIDILFGILSNTIAHIDNLPVLIAYYPLDGNASDISGNNLHGTIIGSLPGTTDRYGIANGAISFNNNTANRIEVDDNLLLQTPSITLSAWVKLNSLGSIRTFVDKPMGTSFTDSWHFGTENSNFSSWHFDAPTLTPYSQVTSPAGTGQWYYVVSTFDNASKQHKLYIDGVLRTTNTFNSTIGYDASKMYIGAAIENGSLAFPMDGAIDEIKIYGSALSASQILTEYQNSLPANVEIISLRSGNGGIGQPDSFVKMLVGPSDNYFSNVFTSADFIAAQNGPPALITLNNGAWISGLPSDPDAKWINDVGNNGSGSTCLHALNFNLDGPVTDASITFDFAIDNTLGGNGNQGLYINGQPVSGNTSNIGDFSGITTISRNDIAPLLQSGLNTLYVNASDLGGPGAVIFSATINATYGTSPGGQISGSQTYCTPVVPAPLTGTSAFNGAGGVAYQWQESNNNLTFTDISGATSLTFQPGLITSDEYFRRKATNTNNEVAFSNVVFIDIIGQTFYADADGDGFGDPGNTIIACSQPPGYLTDNTDCNDADPLQRPGQVWYTDMDNDGYVSSNGTGQPALTITQCSRPAGGKLAAELVSTVGRDCNDNDPTINPLAQRLTISSDPDFANGVYPLQGDPSTTFFFEAIYFDDNNALPSVTFPRAYLDFESNNFINEPQDRIVVMTEFDAADQNTVDGKKYVGSISGLPNGNTWQTFLISEYSNTCQRGTGPFPHPDVLLQPNVQIFANYIEFSDENPPVSSPLSITAYVGNPSDFAVQNVVVRLQNQAEPGTVFPDVTIPYIAAHTSGVATWNITTPAFNGLCPMQVTVDFTNSIAEPNELDNVAVASFNNGNAPVTGDIIVEAGVTPSTSYASANNTLYLDFNAAFNGAGLPAGLKVAGALVTFQIDETGATFTGYTGNEGNIYIPFTAPVSPGVYHISGTVSSPPFTGYINPNITTFTLINGNSPDYSVILGASGLTCIEGQSVEYTIVVTNNGLVGATGNTQLTLSIPGGNPSLLTFVVPPISAGGSYTIPDVNVQFPTAGTYTACAQADALQEIDELNESNNGGCLNVSVNFANPDLEVISGSSGPQSICSPVALYAGIRNSGGVSAAASTSRMVVKQGNTTIQTFNHVVPALGPSEVHSYTETFIPSAPGVYTYSVEADFNHVVAEAIETNNINSFTVNVTPCQPDFVAENCDLSATSATGYTSGNMTLNATIMNVGAINSTAPVRVRFQFSNNTFLDVIHTGGIPKDQSVTVTATTPAFVNPGATMRVIVDPNNTIAELNEANNESLPKPTAWDLSFTGSIEECGPDLTNYYYKPFFSYFLPVKISNYTLYTAATVKVKYQISGPGLIGTVNLATVEAYNVLTSCAVCPQGVSLPSPFVFPQTGTYTLTLTIDPDNEYNEVNESNNVWVVSLEVDNKPDMRVVSNFINPTLLNPAIGEPITVSVTYDNIGSSNVSDLMKMRLFIDNVAIDSISGLSGLASNNYATVNFTIPWSSTVPGTHVIKAIIDSDHVILENDEDNNIATRALTVGSSANLWVKSLSVLNYYPDLNDNITIKTKIENQGDLPTNALVSVFYVNNSLDSVLIAAHQVSLPGNDSISLNIPWVVADNKTKIVVVISNSTALEYNYSDNSAFIELGKMALFTEAFPACETGDKGTMTAYINGGEPPYSYSWSNGAATKSILAAADTYSVTVFDATGQQVSGSGIIPPCTGILIKAKCYLEGYYIAPGIMASVLTQSGIDSPLEYTDTLTVRLHAPSAGFPVTASIKAILHTDGSIVCEFPLSELGNNRYIAIKHRNSIETWSAAPVLISNNMMYNFSTSANQAFGGNMKLLPGGKFGIYSGDADQDGLVDSSDMIAVDNDVSNFTTGYVSTDMNGDGLVDSSDMILVDNNAGDFVGAILP